MRKMKLLSVLLAVLMVVSCIPAALFVGASAEGEANDAEEATVSYKDPRESATKIYYTLVGASSADLAGDEYYESATKISNNSAIYSSLTNGYAGTQANSGGFEAGSVLVIKFKGTVDFNFSTNGGLKRTEYLAFTAPTLFRADGTKLPIVIEGVDAERASTLALSDSAYAALGFANDYYFSNLTIKKTSTSSMTLFAGSGEVVFHDVAFNMTGSITFAGDNYTSDPFYGWTEERFNANKGEDGLIASGFTFGANTSVNSSTILTAVAADGHSGTDAYKTSYPAVGSELTDANISTAETNAKSIKFTSGKLLTNSACIVTPTETASYIVIDNGKAPSDTADFAKVYSRKGCNPVGKSEIKLVSGTVQYMYGDAYSNEKAANGVKSTYTNIPNKEVYVGDVTISIEGGKVLGCVYGLFYSHLIGNYTINMNGGYVQRINGAEGLVSTASIKGNFLFHATGGELVNYYGGCAVIGEGNTVKNVVDGGTFTTVFNGLRFAVTAITNEINGGTFNCAFRGGSNGDYDGGDITNVITGGTFNSDFYAAGTNSSCVLGNVTTNISGGSFKYIGKGGAKASSNTMNVISTKATDEIKLNGAAVTSPRSYDFDSFEMNGGSVIFWAVKVTARNAKGDIVVRNLGDWAEDNTYFAFTPAAGETLNVTPTQSASVATRGTVNVVDGKYLVQADDGFAPKGVSLVLTERIAVKFIFAKADVESVGAENFDLAVLFDGDNIAEGAELVKDGDDYSLTTAGIGLPDAKKLFTLSGNYLKDEGYSIASLADEAIVAWAENDPEWADWAVALKNIINVAVDKGANTLTPADKDYGERQASKADSVTAASATLVMNSAVGVKLEMTCTELPANAVVKVNGIEIADVYSAEGNVATVSLFFAPQAMEDNFTVVVLDGETEIFSLTASVAGFAKELNTDAANALLAYIQATSVVAG